MLELSYRFQTFELIKKSESAIQIADLNSGPYLQSLISIHEMKGNKLVNYLLLTNISTATCVYIPVLKSGMDQYL